MYYFNLLHDPCHCLVVVNQAFCWPASSFRYRAVLQARCFLARQFFSPLVLLMWSYHNKNFFKIYILHLRRSPRLEDIPAYASHRIGSHHCIDPWSRSNEFAWVCVDNIRVNIIYIMLWCCINFSEMSTTIISSMCESQPASSCFLFLFFSRLNLLAIFVCSKAAIATIYFIISL